jgi:mono/diheme cytochrome c family protein
MKRAIILIVLSGLIGIPGSAAWAQETQMVTPPAPSEQEMAGKRLFIQRCSLCHLPPLGRPASARSFGPPLQGFVNTPEREVRVAEVVRRGTGRMPGFQYGLEPKEIDAIVAYLKTFKKPA